MIQSVDMDLSVKSFFEVIGGSRWPTGRFSCMMMVSPLHSSLPTYHPSPPPLTPLNSFTRPPDLSPSNQTLSPPNPRGAKPAPHDTSKIFSTPCCAVYHTQLKNISLQNSSIPFISLFLFSSSEAADESINLRTSSAFFSIRGAGAKKGHFL